jgi:hypothetical protein
MIVQRTSFFFHGPEKPDSDVRIGDLFELSRKTNGARPFVVDNATEKTRRDADHFSDVFVVNFFLHGICGFEYENAL